MAAAGWTAFQEIEREGGLCAALAIGMIEAQADSAAEHRETALRCGKADLVGVTLQPRAETVPVALSAFDTVRRPAAPVEAARLLIQQRSKPVVVMPLLAWRSNQTTTLRLWLLPHQPSLTSQG